MSALKALLLLKYTPKVNLWVIKTTSKKQNIEYLLKGNIFFFANGCHRFTYIISISGL